MRFSGGIRHVGFRELTVRCVDNGLDICGVLSFTGGRVAEFTGTHHVVVAGKGRIGASLHAAARVG